MESDKVKEKIIEALAEDDDLNENVEIVRNVKGVEDFWGFLRAAYRAQLLQVKLGKGWTFK